MLLGEIGKLKENLINKSGKKAENWLDDLPRILNELVSYWGLTNLIPVENMSFNYVAKANYRNQPVVIKIGYYEESITEERKALEYFNGSAVIKILDFSQKFNALLLQQAVPGTTLKSLYPVQSEFVINCYANTASKLHQKCLPKFHSYQHIRDWLTAIDKTNANDLPVHLLQKAIQEKNQLLTSAQPLFFLHGDLHHENILKDSNNWLVIDPKGIVGDLEFEYAAFDFIHDSELESKINLKELFEKRIDLLAQYASINPERLKKWTFIRLILSAAWSIEDNSDPRWAIKLATLLT